MPFDHRKKMKPVLAPAPAPAPAPPAPAPAPTSVAEGISAHGPAAACSGRPKFGPSPKRDYSKLSADEWATMSLAEQEEAMKQINADLDEEMGEEPEWDRNALNALGAGVNLS